MMAPPLDTSIAANRQQTGKNAPPVTTQRFVSNRLDLPAHINAYVVLAANWFSGIGCAGQNANRIAGSKARDSSVEQANQIRKTVSVHVMRRLATYQTFFLACPAEL